MNSKDLPLSLRRASRFSRRLTMQWPVTVNNQRLRFHAHCTFVSVANVAANRQHLLFHAHSTFVCVAHRAANLQRLLFHAHCTPSNAARTAHPAHTPKWPLPPHKLSSSSSPSSSPPRPPPCMEEASWWAADAKAVDSACRHRRQRARVHQCSVQACQAVAFKFKAQSRVPLSPPSGRSCTAAHACTRTGVCAQSAVRCAGQHTRKGLTGWARLAWRHGPGARVLQTPLATGSARWHPQQGLHIGTHNRVLPAGAHNRVCRLAPTAAEPLMGAQLGVCLDAALPHAFPPQMCAPGQPHPMRAVATPAWARAQSLPNPTSACSCIPTQIIWAIWVRAVPPLAHACMQLQPHNPCLACHCHRAAGPSPRMLLQSRACFGVAALPAHSHARAPAAPPMAWHRPSISIGPELDQHW